MPEKNIRLQVTAPPISAGQIARPQWERRPAPGAAGFQTGPAGPVATPYSPRKKAVVKPVYPPGYRSIKPNYTLPPFSTTPPRQASHLYAPLVAFAPTRPKKARVFLPVLITLFILTAFWWLPLLAGFALRLIP